MPPPIILANDAHCTRKKKPRRDPLRRNLDRLEQLRLLDGLAQLPLDDDDDLARISLRLPSGLKRRADRAADRDGVSTNAWIVRAITTNLDHPNHTPTTHARSTSHRVTGWVQ